MEDEIPGLSAYDQALLNWKRSVEAGEPDEDVCLRKGYLSTVKQVGDLTNRDLEFVISTGSVDRMNDTIATNGWELENFIANPVVLWAHSSRDLPIAQATEVGVKKKKLRSVARFTPSGMNRFADTVFEMLMLGFLRACSVGFRPKDWKRVEDDDDRPFGFDFLKQELLEWSVVPIPANPDALIGAKDAGVDLAPVAEWAVRTLDEWTESGSGLVIPRSALERTYELTTKAGKVFAIGLREVDAEAYVVKAGEFDLEAVHLPEIRQAGEPENEETKGDDDEDLEPTNVRFFDVDGEPTDDVSKAAFAEMEIDGVQRRAAVHQAQEEPEGDKGSPSSEELDAIEDKVFGDEEVDLSDVDFGKLFGDEDEEREVSEGDVLEELFADGGEAFRASIKESVDEAVASIRGELD